MVKCDLSYDRASAMRYLEHARESILFYAEMAARYPESVFYTQSQCKWDEIFKRTQTALWKMAERDVKTMLNRRYT